MKIKIDKNNRIVAYATIGDFKDSIEVDYFEFTKPLNDYIFEDNKIKYSPNIERLKHLKREEFKDIRNQKLYENIIVNGDTFQVRKDDLENFWEVDYMLKNREVTGTDTRNWILADNSIKTFTYSELMNVLTAFISRKSKIFDKFGELAIRISMCNSVEEIEQIEW